LSFEFHDNDIIYYMILNEIILYNYGDKFTFMRMN